MIRVVRLLFGETSSSRSADVFLILLFFISLFSATCFFFDSKAVMLFGYKVHLPVGLLFFPATYVISNIIQDRHGRQYANTVVALSFLADVMLVGMFWVMAHLGDRVDYFTVFNALPVIMGATFIFLSVSSIFNTFIFEVTKHWRKKNIVGMFFGFFTSITASEFLVSSMSMPLLFYKNGLKGSIILTILVTVIYKVVFNFVATVIYMMVDNYRLDKQKQAAASTTLDLAEIS